jgi:hypothetical protein
MPISAWIRTLAQQLTAGQPDRTYAVAAHDQAGRPRFAAVARLKATAVSARLTP